MPTYKGIPFNGGMDAPTGTGAQSIVETCQAICDWAQMADVAGLLKDAANTPSVDFQNRALKEASGTATVLWGNGWLLDPSGNLVVDWTASALWANGFGVVEWLANRLNDTAGVESHDWHYRQLIDTDGVTIQIAYAGGLSFPSLPTADPHVVGQVWNNLGIVTVSAG